MPVFDINDHPVKPDLFADKLIGSLCEITFTLRHYNIGAQTKKDGSEAHDVFSAQVEAVLVLKNPPVIVRSPFKGRTNKRPHHRPQIPTRGEQVNAAAAFVSQPDVGSTSATHQTVPTNIAATFAAHGAPSTFITISGDSSTLLLPPTTPVANNATNFTPPVTTPINAILTTSEAPIEPVNTPVATGSNNHSIASTSGSATSRPAESLTSPEAVPITQAPPSKKRKVATSRE